MYPRYAGALLIQGYYKVSLDRRSDYSDVAELDKVTGGGYVIAPIADFVLDSYPRLTGEMHADDAGVGGGDDGYVQSTHQADLYYYLYLMHGKHETERQHSESHSFLDKKIYHF